MFRLEDFVTDFANAMRRVDARKPIAVNKRSGLAFRSGIGPHSEDDVVRMVMADLGEALGSPYSRYRLAVPYPDAPRSKCDLHVGERPDDWALEIKLLRFLGDNGKQNGQMLMHILSPYKPDRSALTDCEKLGHSELGSRKAILIFGYEHEEWPLDPAIDAFEHLASRHGWLGPRNEAEASDLVHPVHSIARVFAWQLCDPS